MIDFNMPIWYDYFIRLQGGYTMKKLLSALIALSLLTGGMGVFAATPSPTSAPSETAAPTATPAETPDTSAAPEESAQPSSEPEVSVSPSPTASAVPIISGKDTSDEFKLEVYIKYHKFTRTTDAVIELYSESGELLGTASEKVTNGTKKLTMTYKVPRYKMGQKFKVKLVSGLRSISYYRKKVEPGGILDVETYSYTDENGNYKQCNGCAMDANPQYDKELCMYVNGNFLKDLAPAARMVDGVAMMPVRAIGEAMGLKVTYDKRYNSVVCSIGSDEVIFNAGSAYTTIFGKDTYSPHPTIYIEDSLFVPVRTLAEAFGSKLDVLDFDDHLDIVIGESPMVREYRNRTPVNRNGITSRTKYLVWVLKSEYRVRVYEGSQYHWDELKSFPCALGAWDTPTITGQFEYIERTRWDYPGYYVGPVLRFYNGYALHSTLLNYNGTEFDGRVGVNISHGCVRLHPQDINWIANTIPFGTRIYITE